MARTETVKIAYQGRFVCEAGVARSFWSKTKGLMFRPSLGKGKGLLMEFENEGKPGIWMLFMRFPIDIIFLDRAFRVVGIRENVPPVGWRPSSWKVYYPDRPARYVLEVRAGTAGRIGAGLGSSLAVNFDASEGN